jgi:hypothetical protein
MVPNSLRVPVVIQKSSFNPDPGQSMFQGQIQKVTNVAQIIYYPAIASDMAHF